MYINMFINVASFLWDICIYAVSDQNRHRFLTECSINFFFFFFGGGGLHRTPKIGNWLVLLIRVGKSIWLSSEKS